MNTAETTLRSVVSDTQGSRRSSQCTAERQARFEQKAETSLICPAKESKHNTSADEMAQDCLEKNRMACITV